VVKERRILLEGVQDHIVSSLHGKATPHEIWKVLMDLFQKKMTIGNWHSKINSGRSRWRRETPFQKYLMKSIQCQDDLGSVGITIATDDLVSLALPGLPKNWHSYQDSINGRENFPDWE
jgi:hypothetical protein